MSKRISKLLVISVICVLFLSLGSQVFAQKLPVVGISTGSSGTSWRDIMIAAMQEVGDEYKAAGKIADYKIVNNIVNGDATEQANILRDFISQGMDIIMVNPNSPDALNGVIKEAQEEGILVVSFDATVTAPDVVNITLDHYAWNKKNVEFIASTLQKGNAVQIYGLEGHPANNERIRATYEVLANYPDIKLIADTSGYWDQTKAKEVATQIIASGQQIDAVITQDGMAFGILSAFLDANKLPKVMYGDPGTAFFKEWKKLRDQGADFKACTQPNPPGIGGTAFRIALQLYNGKNFKPDILKDNTFYYQVSMFVTDENFDEAWELLKDKPDDYLLSEIMSEEEVAALFE
ncbi:substrate-binding domain-containing protein [Candidatus Sordicultor fermentans]|jgi:ribose transport system substrate-binding protein|uniref:substrate-binding domain-containing protein n=1 Tax=Candidatus Sordicultor fermentans TaxID=1953203 RepID=UPI0016938D98|nr:substrate-binding domain-containing protein [Atribacterota bacterium]NLY05720.1 substrate-binding domain-containing protein [Candidatus Atribacteria bacterium]MDI9607339.1 substrate-binding domain-containing protein [Atribacterota bacterium]HOA99130.1 substrate-binding domain-containing protein [Candidatus Atribacteria bacterium]HPZ39258.1 substrate-binding domain-containing protein [Candidatus Atribacteria bacterium]